MLRNAAHRKSIKADDAEWESWVAEQNGRMTSKVAEIIEPAARHLSADEDVARMLAETMVEGWQEALAAAETREQGDRAGAAWADAAADDIEQRAIALCEGADDDRRTD